MELLRRLPDRDGAHFHANADLLGKVYFHRLATHLSVVISNLIAFGIQLGMLLVILIAFSVSGDPLHVNVFAPLTPVYLLMLAGHALSGGIIVCAHTTQYRDVLYLITFGVQRPGELSCGVQCLDCP